MMNEFYNNNWKKYIAETENIDMTFIYDTFTPRLPAGGHILDVGFGSGRDMRAFIKRGFKVSGIDPCKEFVEYNKDLDVRQLTVEELDEENKYDAIFASASLIHVEDITKALDNCYRALKEGGIMFATFKYGEFEGIKEGRYLHYQTLDTLRVHLSDTDFVTVDFFITDDVRSERREKQERWFNIILKK